jgi:hypothetical protein
MPLPTDISLAAVVELTIVHVRDGVESSELPLARENVDCIFGYPGGVTLPLYDAIYDHHIHRVWKPLGLVNASSQRDPGVDPAPSYGYAAHASVRVRAGSVVIARIREWTGVGKAW